MSPWAPLSYDFLRRSWGFDDLTILRSAGQVFCRMAFSWDLPDVSLMIRPGLGVLERKATEVQGHSHHIVQNTLYQHGLSLMVLTLIPWPRYVKWLSPLALPPILFSLELSHYLQPCLRTGELCSSSWRESICINYLEFFCMGAWAILYIFI